MILKCPNCGEQYEIRSRGGLEDFTMKCQSCGTEISAAENEEVEIITLSKAKETEKKSGHGCLWTFLIFILVLVVMALTKPDKSKHAEKVRELGLELMNDKVQSQNNLTQGLAFLLGPTVMDLFLSGGLQIDDYVIFNVGRIKFQDIDKPVTVGVFNNVILLARPKDQDTTD